MAEVPKDQAVFQKAKGCQEGSLGSLGSLNDAAMAGKKSAGSALGSMHQVRPSPGLYHFLVSMVSNYSFLFLVFFSQPLGRGNEEIGGIYFGWSGVRSTQISGFMHCSSAEDMDTLKNLRSVREKLGEDIRNKRGPDLSRIAV